METRKTDTLTKRIIFTIFIIILIRTGNFIPIPRIDQRYLINIGQSVNQKIHHHLKYNIFS